MAMQMLKLIKVSAYLAVASAVIVVFFACAEIWLAFAIIALMFL